MQKHRIYTNIGRDQKINVEILNSYDLMEILSLKFSQKDIYASGNCSEYGVVMGRVSVNDGFGIPNARISIFVPLSDIDENDPVISALYPYKDVSDKNENNYRYNLLPSRQQHSGHEPTGTFFDQEDILTREECLEVFEKYYKYTVKTNNAGDFMIWGVPIGSQTLHIDVDLSDIGCFSLRPNDFIRNGYGVDEFKSLYEFKSSSDLDSLPQIKSFNKTINVYPFWGNEEICEIGITRTDFDLSDQGVKIEPKAYLIGGIYTDTGKNAINKNCMPRKKMGRKCDLTTRGGKISAIRFTTQKDTNGIPILEEYKINEDIDEDGVFVLALPMNMDYIYTNEFGENEITNDSNKGIPTSACYRLRIELTDSGLDRVRVNADYLVPNIREYTTDTLKSYAWSTSFDDYPSEALSNDPDRGIFYIQDNQYYPRDYFYRFTYNKVYTVSSFQSSYFKNFSYTGDKYLGIKEIEPPEEEDCTSTVLTPPVNFGKKNYTFALLVTQVLLFFEQLINLVTFVFFNALAKALHTFANAFNVWPIKSIHDAVAKVAYAVQEAGQRELYLINYPECEECNGEDNEFGTQKLSAALIDYCQVGTISVTGSTSDTNRSIPMDNWSFSVEDIGVCKDEAEPITDMDDLVDRQSHYALIDNNRLVFIQLTGSTLISAGGWSGYVFGDTNIDFPDSTVYNLVIVDIHHRADPSTPTYLLETGCEIYDIPYDEDIVAEYYSGTTSNRITIPHNDYLPGMNISSSKIADGGDYRLLTEFGGVTYTPTTPSGYSEFSNGVFYFIPGGQTINRIYNILKEYRRRKLVGQMFCGGIVNYSYIDNWLSGSLYFYQFKAKFRQDSTRIKYCTDIAQYIPDQKRFYYRSTEYISSGSIWGTSVSGNNKRLGHSTTFIDLGPRDEFIKEICIDTSLDPNCSVSRSIGPTTYQSWGELLGMVINYWMDVSNNEFTLNNFFKNEGYPFSSYVLNGDILQLISINNETGIEEFDLQSPKYLGYSYQIIDPELCSSIFRPYGNDEWGPTPITFDLSEDGQRIRLCLNEPTHLDYQGNTVQGRLTESSQKVPFFLWDKKGTGFGGISQDTAFNQFWCYSGITVQPLQGMTYGYVVTGQTYDDSSDQYLLLPITYNFSGMTFTDQNVTDELAFDIVSASDNHTDYDTAYPGFTYLYASSWIDGIPVSGTLYTRYGHGGIWDSQAWNTSTDFIIKKTVDYYSGTTKQILSTPFQFYFGLRPGKTGLDKFMKLFGPLGVLTAPTPTPLPTLPLPSPEPTPSLTPTPTASSAVWYYRLNRCIDNVSTYYTEHSAEHLSVGTAVWGASVCDPDYAYVVIGSTTNESNYAGYTKLGGVSVELEHAACFDCDDNPITPPPSPPAYTTIVLVRNTSEGDPAGSTCGDFFYNAENKQTAYVNSPSIIPHNLYDAYEDTTWTTRFNGGNLYWGIKYDANLTITHTVYVSTNGNIQDWANCP
jgi:hypothetical protein